MHYHENIDFSTLNAIFLYRLSQIIKTSYIKHCFQINVLLFLQELGYGEIDHYPEISGADLLRLSEYFRTYCNISTPQGLQDKVQFDIRFYFCRRGLENLHDFTKDTFVIRR